MDYRREIDGLRALAVVPVVLFHAGIGLFSGGYVGVDVFFVISGYLITSIIVAEISEGRFSFANFYERRARRILPALFLVLFCSMPAAWFFLMPSDLKSFSQSVVAVTTFSANVFFWKTSGYFEAATELKPLLHTWSLALEEQFYFVFPVFIVVTWRLGTRWMIGLLVPVALLSLGLSQWGSAAKPAFTFYLLPTRIWELLIGAFLALCLANRRISSLLGSLSSSTAGVLGGIGLFLCCMAVLGFDKSTPYPSFYALVPTVGTAMIILFAAPQTVVGKLLGSPPFVGVGLISYSAYLWHQPIFAFARQFDPNLSGHIVTILLSVAPFVLAFFSWRFVEIPFRDKRRFSRRFIFVFAAGGSFLFAAIGFLGHRLNGNLGQLSSAQLTFLSYFENELPEWRYVERLGIHEKYRIDCDFFDVQRYRIGKQTQLPVAAIDSSCYTKTESKPNSVFIWGDSHAQQLYWGLAQVLPSDWAVLQVASSGCIPAVGAVEDKTKYCKYSNWFAYSRIRDIRPNVVLIAQRDQHSVSEMKTIRDALLNLGVGKVVFAGPVPQWRLDLPSIVAKKFLFDTPKRTTFGLDREVLASDSVLKSNFPVSSNAIYVSLVDYFCDSRGCLVYDGDDVVTGITSADYGHLTPVASQILARDLLASVIIK